MNRNSRLLFFLAIPGVIWLGLGLGCNRSPGDLTPPEYFVAGTLVQVMDHDDAHASARVWRDGEFFATGMVRFAGTDLDYLEAHLIDSAYQHVFHPAALLAGDTFPLEVQEGNSFIESIDFNVVDTFSITDNFQPANRLLPGGGQVSLEWTAAANAEGYIIAAVKADTTYMGAGYSALTGTGLNAGTIPSDVFVDPASSELDTGLYYVYVYAFNGAPDSAQASHWLPTALPQQFAGNVDQSGLGGRFGTISVTLHDSVEVTSGR